MQCQPEHLARRQTTRQHCLESSCVTRASQEARGILTPASILMFQHFNGCNHGVITGSRTFRALVVWSGRILPFNYRQEAYSPGVFYSPTPGRISGYGKIITMYIVHWYIRAKRVHTGLAIQQQPVYVWNALLNEPATFALVCP
jgi:hypothetical protein